MSAATEVRTRMPLLWWAAAAAGLLLLVLRAYAPFGMPLLVGTYLALASLAVVPGRDALRAPLHPALVVALGFAAVLAAGWAGGAGLPSAGVTFTAIGLNTLAAVGEEAFFRKFLYDRTVRLGPPAAVVITALLFAAVHVPAYGVAAFPVDLGAGLFLGWQRWASGTWAAPAATHAFANLVAVLR